MRTDIWKVVMTLKDNKSDTLFSRYFIIVALVAGFVLIFIVASLSTYIEKRNTDKELATVIDYIKTQYNNYIEFNNTEAAKSLIRKAESAKLIEDCDETSTEAHFKQHCEELAATGITLVDSNLNTLVEYTKDGVGFEQFRHKLRDDAIQKVMLHHNDAYMKRMELEDHSYVDVAILKCSGGAVLVYRHTIKEFATKSVLSIQNVLDGYDPDVYGTIVITDGDEIVASNSDNFTSDNISEVDYQLVYDIRDAGKADTMVSVKSSEYNQSYFGRYSHGREYYICALVPERTLLEKTTPVVIITGLLYIFFIIVMQFLRLRTSSKLIAEQKEQEHAYQLALEKKNLELTDAVDKAEAANLSKRAFLFNMSHDIRTPMNAIIGFTNLAEQNIDDKDKVGDYLGKIMTSSKHLLALINDILDMSRIENGKVNIEAVPVCIKDQMQLVEDVVKSEIEANGLTYIEKTENLDDIYVYADALHVNRVLVNILSNAVKFTPEGGTITFTMRERKSPREGYAYYDFIIEDTGIGMSEEFQEHIFEQFAREKTSTVSHTQGTGLGMSITKSLVELMGGDITVQSELGKGSVFTVTLEFQKTTEDMVSGKAVDQGALSDSDITGKRVLLAEDNDLNMEIAVSILEAMGLEIETAKDGSEALEKIKAKPADYYDLVLMDIQMPMMDGYETTRAIRALDDPDKANVPIVAMTANAFAEDRKNAFDAGMNDHIAKPLDVEIVAQVITEQLQKDSEEDWGE